ncbi:MAG TPA: hypothetical protein VHO69_02400 [Phototrophicaceae bacterium]|nr:hypothetical protein [Phototrophicaceae bacterium]
MPLATYEPIQKSKVEYQIQDRYQREITELKTLGFRDLSYTREVFFPYSVLVFFFLYPIMRLNREIFHIEAPLRYVLLSPLLVSEAAGTYAFVFGRGVKFYTECQDGTVLLSCTFPGADDRHPESQFYGFYARAKNERAIATVWQQHQARIKQLEQAGAPALLSLSLEHFESLSQREDHALLWGGRSRQKQK